MGILTNRDLRFEKNLNQPVNDAMTKENLVTVPVGTTLEEAERILQKHRIEKLLVVDKDFNLKGLITVKDIQKKLEFPNAAKDEQGRLRVGAAIGATGDFLERAEELARTKVDVLAIDTAHGHSSRVMEAIRAVKRALPEMQLMAGNVATFEGARDLIALGHRRVEGGDRARLDLHDARDFRRGRAADHRDPGSGPRGEGDRRAGDRRRRHEVFRRHHQGHCGRRLSGDDREPFCGNGRISRRNDSVSGPHVQIVSRHGLARGDGCGLGRPLRAGRRRSAANRCPKASKAACPTKGRSARLVDQLVGGLRSGMGYCGVENLAELQEKARFLRISSAGLRESHVHDVIITREAPNYRVE